MNRVECQDVMRFGQQLALSYSSARNVLFDFSNDYRVGEGRTRRLIRPQTGITIFYHVHTALVCPIMALLSGIAVLMGAVRNIL